MVKAKILNNTPFCSKCGGELRDCKSVGLTNDNKYYFIKACKECNKDNYYYATIFVDKETKRY